MVGRYPADDLYLFRSGRQYLVNRADTHDAGGIVPQVTGQKGPSEELR